MSKAATALKTETRAASVPTHMVAIADLYLATEAPKGVDLQVRDSGRGSPLTDEELKASIYNNGIIHALIWKEHAGKKYVVAGNRRLRFLREIFADDLATEVRTENVADYPGDWRDVAMDTNLALPPHVVERYEMISRIAREEKLSESEVCRRYGMSDSQYRRVMALGKMSPVIRQAWKDAKIDARAAQAFTLEPDPKEQERIFTKLVKESRSWRDEDGDDFDFRIDHHDVRGAIVPHTQRHTAQLVAFVGLEAVRKAKLLKQEDLFGGDHIVTDLKGLNKLVGDKMAEERKKLLEQGWSWVVRKEDLVGQEYQYGDVKSKDGAYTAEQMKRAGCILKIGHSGELEIVYGKVKPAEKQAAAAAERRATSPAKPKKKTKPGEVLMTHALADRQSLNFERAISGAMVAAPYVCVAAMIAGFASYGELITVSVGNRDDGDRYARKFDEEKTFLQAFEGALKASPEQQVVMLAKVAAEALEVHTFNGEDRLFKNGRPTLQALVKALPKTVVDKMLTETFDAADYFGNVAQQVIVDAVSCSMGPDFARDVAKMKKKDAAKFAAEHVKAKGYLPPFMRTAHYTGPIEKAAPAKKAKAAKKAEGRKPSKKK